MGCETQSPAQESYKKNVEETETFVSTFEEQISNAIAAKRCDFQSVRLFSQDESRYGLLPVVSRRITLPGIKPVAEIDYSYESVYLYGAVEPLTGEGVFYEFSHLTADCFQIFLNKFSHAFPESLNLLVLDNGRFHHAKCLEIPDNVLLLFLPPYSPELNPIERFWQDIKVSKLFIQTYKTLADMQAKVTEILQNYCEATIAQLTSFSHFINATNAI